VWLAASIAALCSSAPVTPLTGIAQAVAAPGAIIEVELKTKVGVLLDEVPAGRLRDGAAADALGQDNAFWKARARNHVKLNYYRLVYRGLIYGDATKGPLPLTPESTWDIRPIGRARRELINGHDLVTQDYQFSSYIVTDVDSPGRVEPNLARVGGFWDESLLLPADPELVLQRTGYACMDEDEFPLGSVFEENTWYFYDQTCGVETADTASCHLTQLPAESCVGALTSHVGKVRTHITFKRLAYDSASAAPFRVGTLDNPTGADLSVVHEQLADEQAVRYRFFDPASCEIVEHTDVTTLFRDPKHPYTRGLIGSIPVVGAAVDELAVIPGMVPNLIDLPSACRFAPRCLARVEAKLEICEEQHPDLRPVDGSHEVRCWLYHDASGGLIPEDRLAPVARRKTP
jgi:oligopeptide/dipeptide ABC transporter ATP-binding protein